jgi:uncharacterized protein
MLTYRWLLFVVLAACIPCTAMIVTSIAAPEKAPPTVAAHNVIIQVDDNDPKLMNLALNNAANVREYYAAKGMNFDIRIVTFGPGLHMLRRDTSPVKDRIAEMSLAMPELKFLACGNTQSRMAQSEQKDISLISEAVVVPSGVVTIIELQERGYAYVRP